MTFSYTSRKETVYLVSSGWEDRMGQKDKKSFYKNAIFNDLGRARLRNACLCSQRSGNNISDNGWWWTHSIAVILIIAVYIPCWNCNDQFSVQIIILTARRRGGVRRHGVHTRNISDHATMVVPVHNLPVLQCNVPAHTTFATVSDVKAMTAPLVTAEIIESTVRVSVQTPIPYEINL